MGQKEPQTMIKSIIREMIDEKVSNLLYNLEENEFEEELKDRLDEHEVKEDDDYDYVVGKKMDNEILQKFIDEVTEMVSTKINVTNENW